MIKTPSNCNYSITFPITMYILKCKWNKSMKWPMYFAHTCYMVKQVSDNNMYYWNWDTALHWLTYNTKCNLIRYAAVPIQGALDWEVLPSRYSCPWGQVLAKIMLVTYSSPPLIRPPYLPRNCGHITEVAFGERDKYMHSKEQRQKFVATSEKVTSVESGH